MGGVVLVHEYGHVAKAYRTWSFLYAAAKPGLGGQRNQRGNISLARGLEG
jgi:hypothetical protein